MDTGTIPTGLPPVISRDEALQIGLKRFFTGKVCANGHLSERFASNKHCCECTVIHRRKSQRKPEHVQNRKAWKEKNKERIYEQNKALRQTPEGRAKACEYAKRHKEKYPDKVKARISSWRDRNKDHIRDYDRQRYADKKCFQHTPAGTASMLARTRNRRALQRAAEGSHNATDIQDIHKLQRGRCAICREKLNGRYHVDHIRPLAKGGGNARSNLQLACGPCNQAKHAKDPIEFMQSLGKLL